MKNYELLPGEESVKEAGGDCWETPGSLRNQVPGKYMFTNRRIIFVGNGVIEKLRVRFEIPYSEIQSVTPYRVVFFSTGILIRMKNGDSYRLSLRKRDQYIAMIRNYMDMV
ncbi:PH domain-containing protein [Enterocloster sp. OA13]|uniref:PH domain-containing protein n=1 Tax=Enterocloster sp. OA13 TaxID=2914161 RepID=UPI0004707CF0|nr:PH domain-containing protein [Enterocloster sp. OA13]